MAGEMRQNQQRCQQAVRDLEVAGRAYIDDGVRLLALAHNARKLFDAQPEFEKRRLLDFVLSNCTWGHGQIMAAYKQPFDIIAKKPISLVSIAERKTRRESRNENWLRG